MAEQGDLEALLASRTSGEIGTASQLGPRLQQAVDDARRAWPNIELADEAFIEYLVARMQPGEDVAGLPHRLYVIDLYLACAVVRGSPGAVAAFDDALLSRVGQFIAGVSRAPAFVAEVTQTLRVKLLVGSDGQGKLSQYSGRGPLASWVCAAAMRTAYDLGRAGARELAQDDDHGLDVLAASGDPEIDLLRRRHDGEFRVALETALASLASRDRALLRLYFIERLTAAQIGKIYRVHETTVLRWIATARQAVADRVRRDLSQSLGLSSSEFEELLELMRSRLDVSVGRLLETPGER
jgi:RNA polymerase sigma-70 factor (ECF subfamily)